MIDLYVRLTDCKEDMHIYTDVSEVSIKDDKISVKRDDECFIHDVDQLNEIVITPHR